MGKTYIFGHKNPDTDSITSSIVMANLETKLGNNVEACRLGVINKETEYVLNYFGVQAPTLVESIEDGRNVILVDHGNPLESVDNLDKLNILKVVDHHPVKITVAYPLYYRAEPVGCTQTILYKMYKEYNVEVDKKIAGLMLSAIISDTLILKSPTTTERDKEAVENLASIAGVDYKKYGYSMLKAGSSIEGLTVEDLIYQDFKSYKVGNTSLGISQVITMDFDSLKDNIDEYVEKLDEIAKRDYSTVTLFITDIVENGSYVLYNTEAKHIIEDSFDIIDIEEGTFIPDLVSRKKQMLPQIMETLEKNS